MCNENEQTCNRPVCQNPAGSGASVCDRRSSIFSAPPFTRSKIRYISKDPLIKIQTSYEVFFLVRSHVMSELNLMRETNHSSRSLKIFYDSLNIIFIIYRWTIYCILGLRVESLHWSSVFWKMSGMMKLLFHMHSYHCLRYEILAMYLEII